MSMLLSKQAQQHTYEYFCLKIMKQNMMYQLINSFGLIYLHVDTLVWTLMLLQI